MQNMNTFYCDHCLYLKLLKQLTHTYFLMKIAILVIACLGLICSCNGLPTVHCIIFKKVSLFKEFGQLMGVAYQKCTKASYN